MLQEPSLVSVKALVLLDNDGKRVFSKVGH